MAASWEVKEGPVLDVLRSMPSASVHASITSPPYFGLRAYEGDQVVDWPAVEFYPMPGLDAYMPPITIPAGPAALGAVALSLGRRYIGIELSSEYAAMSRERIGGAQPALFGL